MVRHDETMKMSTPSRDVTEGAAFTVVGPKGTSKPKKSKINQSKKSKAARRALALLGPATVAALPKSRVSVLERGRYENGRQCLLCASSRPLQVNKVRKARVWNDFGRFARHLLELHVDEAFFFQCSARADGTYPLKTHG